MTGGARGRAGAAGLLAAATGVVLGEVTAALLHRPTPVVSVGTQLVDSAPGPVARWAVDTFGHGDKPLLVTGILVVLAVLAVAVGRLGAVRRPTALVLTGLVGLLAVAAAATARGHDHGPATLLPSLVQVLTATGALALLLSPFRPAVPTVAEPTRLPEEGVDRRAFVRASSTVAAVGLTGVGVRAVLAARPAPVSAPALPAPTTAAPAVTGADLGVPGLTPYLTANRDFYRVDIDLLVPRLDARRWRLRVDGLVAEPLELAYDDLLALPLVEHDVTLTCVSNEVGGGLVGNARWLGVRVADVLARARPLPAADMVLSHGADGFTASTPVGALTDPARAALLAVGMNGVALPVAHGFPVRMVVPGLYGFVSATKWLTRLELTRYADASAYWTQRGWSPYGVVKTASRIEVPRGGTVPAGRVVVAGTAWAQHRGIARVEVQVDDGTWQQAELAPWHEEDTWRQWRWVWPDAARGRHVLRVRATDAAGAVQTADGAAPFPDGATGLHEVTVRVR
jgi:DMSO/TMAO reductase YedYZ molybdopterin-dependent catalytic subunit